MPAINPQQVNTLVRTDPEKALADIHAWDIFVRSRLKVIPELGTILRQNNPALLKKEWDNLIDKRQDIPRDVINGAFIRLYWPANPIAAERPQELNTELTKIRKGRGIGSAIGKGIGIPFGFLIPKQELLENDEEYQKIRNQLEKEWHDQKAEWVEQWKVEQSKKGNAVVAPDPKSESLYAEYIAKINHALETTSPYSKAHELNYFYGNIDSQTVSPTIDDEAKALYANHVRLAEHTIDHFAPPAIPKTRAEKRDFGKAKKLLNNDKRYKRIEKTPYKIPSRDPFLNRLKERFDAHLNARLQYRYFQLLQQNPNLSFEEFLTQNNGFVQDLIYKVQQAEQQRFQNFVSKKTFNDPKQASLLQTKYSESYYSHLLQTSAQYIPEGIPFSPELQETPHVFEDYEPGGGRPSGPNVQQVKRVADFVNNWKTKGPGEAFKNFFSDINPLNKLGNLTKGFENAGEFLNPIGNALKPVADTALQGLSKGLSGLFGEGGLLSGLGGIGGTEAAALPAETAAVTAGGLGLTEILIALLPFLILLIIILAFIFMLWILFSHPNPAVYVQVACSEEPGQLDAKGIGLAIANDFGISLQVNGNAATQLNNSTPNLQAIMAVEKRMYDDLCRLYGHAAGANGKPFSRTPDGKSTLGSDNTLGNLFRGFDHFYDSTGVGAGGHVTNVINLWIQPVSGKTQCTADLIVHNNNPNWKPIDMDLWMYQPDQCLTNPTDQTNLNTPDYALEFLLDKYLGLKLIDRLADEKKKPTSDPHYKDYKVYDDFLSQVYKNGTSLLPNPECQTPGKDQPKNCFAVMIADYTTWGAYANFQLNACIPGQVGAEAQKTADLASQLVNTVGKPLGGGGCGGTVNTGNMECLYNLNPVPNPGGRAVEDRLHLNTSEDGNLQCAGFAQAVAIGIGKPIGDGDAASYIGRNTNDYEWIPNDGKNTIQVGDYPVWARYAGQFPVCEHIAVVVPFPGQPPQSPGLTKFRTAAANVNGQGDLIFFNYSVHDTFCTLQGWLRLKNAGSPTSSCPVGGNASDRIKPINSGDPNQYPHQPKSWMYSSCSGCSFAEVMNAYGKNLTCGEVLQYEFNKGYWDPSVGFHGWIVRNIQDIADHFGFTAVVGQGDKTLDQVIAIANGGQPVVVGLGGHILVIKGGNQNNVVLVDSLTGTIHTDSRSVFLNGGVDGDPNFKWDGTYAILTPK